MSLLRRKEGLIKKGPLKTGYFISDGGVTQITYRSETDPYILLKKMSDAGINVLDTVPVDAWAALLAERLDGATINKVMNILNLQVPEGGKLIARWYSGGSTTYAFEFPPGVYPIVEDISSKSTVRFLSFPYMYMFLVFRESGFARMIVYFRQHQIKHTYAILEMAPLSNIMSYENHTGAYVCLGSNRIDSNRPHHEQVLQAIRVFFDSPFSGQPEWNRVVDGNFPKTWDAWENHTRHNPKFAQKVQWKQLKQTFADVMGMKAVTEQATTTETLLNQVFNLALRHSGETGDLDVI